jgi:hypothetical protein
VPGKAGKITGLEKVQLLRAGWYRLDVIFSNRYGELRCFVSCWMSSGTPPLLELGILILPAEAPKVPRDYLPLCCCQKRRVAA